MPPHEIGLAVFATPLILLALAGWARPPDAPPAGRSREYVVAGDEASPSPRAFPFHSGNRWLGNGVCYGPHRDGQWPGGPTPTTAQIREDLHQMLPHWSLLRLYGSGEFGGKVLAAIRADSLDMKVMLGVWIAAEEVRDERGAVVERRSEAAAANRRETEAAITLAAEYPDIVAAVCVGNETQVFWSPHPSPLDILIDHIRRVRAAVAIPVTTADDYQYWVKPESRTLAREIDFVTIHAHPLWNGQPLSGALPWLREQLAAVRSVHPDRLVVIGETGWATAAAGEGEQARLIKGTPGETEQAVYYADVRTWASVERVSTFFFEAFDENWKGGDNPEEVEKHWGLFRADRTPKAAVRHDESRSDH